MTHDPYDPEEAAYMRGSQVAWQRMLQECVSQLDLTPTARRHHLWLAERQSAIAVLRRLCAAFGDNDWPDDLHLEDILKKHLEQSLREAQERKDS